MIALGHERRYRVRRRLRQVSWRKVLFVACCVAFLLACATATIWAQQQHERSMANLFDALRAEYWHNMLHDDEFRREQMEFGKQVLGERGYAELQLKMILDHMPELEKKPIVMSVIKRKILPPERPESADDE